MVSLRFVAGLLQFRTFGTLVGLRCSAAPGFASEAIIAINSFSYVTSGSTLNWTSFRTPHRRTSRRHRPNKAMRRHALKPPAEPM